MLLASCRPDLLYMILGAQLGLWVRQTPCPLHVCARSSPLFNTFIFWTARRVPDLQPDEVNRPAAEIHDEWTQHNPERQWPLHIPTDEQTVNLHVCVFFTAADEPATQTQRDTVRGSVVTRRLFRFKMLCGEDVMVMFADMNTWGIIFTVRWWCYCSVCSTQSKVTWLPLFISAPALWPADVNTDRTVTVMYTPQRGTGPHTGLIFTQHQTLAALFLWLLSRDRGGPETVPGPKSVTRSSGDVLLVQPIWTRPQSVCVCVCVCVCVWFICENAAVTKHVTWDAPSLLKLLND